MTLEYRMSQYMDLHTHRCKTCGGQFMPIKVTNGYATVAGFILFIVGFVFISLIPFVGIFIAMPLYFAAFGLFLMKITVFKCHQCERVFDP